MTSGRQIKIYLADRSVMGIRNAEIVNWTGQALAESRKLVKELGDWEESLKLGFSFYLVLIVKQVMTPFISMKQSK